MLIFKVNVNCLFYVIQIEKKSINAHMGAKNCLREVYIKFPAKIVTLYILLEAHIFRVK